MMACRTLVATCEARASRPARAGLCAPRTCACVRNPRSAQATGPGYQSRDQGREEKEKQYDVKRPKLVRSRGRPARRGRAFENFRAYLPQATSQRSWMDIGSPSASFFRSFPTHFERHWSSSGLLNPTVASPDRRLHRVRRQDRARRAGRVIREDISVDVILTTCFVCFVAAAIILGPICAWVGEECLQTLRDFFSGEYHQ